jgi:hypothetical protein
MRHVVASGWLFLMTRAVHYSSTSKPQAPSPRPNSVWQVGLNGRLTERHHERCLAAIYADRDAPSTHPNPIVRGSWDEALGTTYGDESTREAAGAGRAGFRCRGVAAGRDRRRSLRGRTCGAGQNCVMIDRHGRGLVYHGGGAMIASPCPRQHTGSAL